MGGRKRFAIAATVVLAVAVASAAPSTVAAAGMAPASTKPFVIAGTSTSFQDLAGGNTFQRVGTLNLSQGSWLVMAKLYVDLQVPTDDIM